MNIYQLQMNSTISRLSAAVEDMSVDTDIQTLNDLRVDIDRATCLAKGLRLDVDPINDLRDAIASRITQLFSDISPNNNQPPEGWFNNHKYWIS